jgi:hypothetical protein
MKTITRLDNPDAITYDVPHRSATFKLKDDPQLYTITYDFNNVVLAEEKTSLNLLQGLMGGGSATIMRGLLFAFLLKAHPTVLIDEAGDLLSKECGTVMTALSSLLAHFSQGLVNEDVPEPGDVDDADVAEAAATALLTKQMNAEGKIPIVDNVQATGMAV